MLEPSTLNMIFNYNQPLPPLVIIDGNHTQVWDIWDLWLRAQLTVPLQAIIHCQMGRIWRNWQRSSELDHTCQSTIHWALVHSVVLTEVLLSIPHMQATITNLAYIPFSSAPLPSSILHTFLIPYFAIHFTSSRSYSFHFVLVSLGLLQPYIPTPHFI